MAKWHRVLVCLLLAAIAYVPYAQTIRHEFINYDDDEYISSNSVVLKGLTWEGFRWSLSAIQVGNWQPLTGLSLMLDCDLYRRPDGSQWPGGHHLNNALFHVANSLLMLWALHLLTGAFWRSALVAALFAVHPTHVESVAWAAERKDVLSTFFGLLAIGGYAWYVRQPSARRMALVCLVFALNLLAKPMLVTLPCALLLFDIWPLRRWRLGDVGEFAETNAADDGVHWKRLFLEKAPLFVMSAGACAVALVTQHVSGAMTNTVELPLAQRMTNAIVAYAAYLDKLAFPRNLALIYPLPVSRDTLIVVGSAAAILLITAVALWQRRRRPWLLIGWLFYLGTLVPVIGLIQVGGQSMADRYLYVPATGIFVMLAWSIPSLRSQAGRFGIAAICIAVVAAFMVGATAQAAYWRDSKTLFTHVLAVTDHNAIAHLQLGEALEAEGKTDAAIEHYRQAVSIGPNYQGGRELLANALIKLNRPDEAFEHLSYAYSLRPTKFVTHHLGMILLAKNRLPEAEQVLRKCVELDPADTGRSRENLATVLIQEGKLAEARQFLDEAVTMNPNSSQAHNNLGIIFISTGQIDQAAQSLQRALELDPNNLECRGNYGMVLLQLQRFDEAIKELSTVKAKFPQRFGVRTNLALALAGAGQKEEALAELNAVLRESPDFAPAKSAMQKLAADDASSKSP